MNRTQITVLLLVSLCVAVGYAWIATPKQCRVDPRQSTSRYTDQQQQKTTAVFPAVTDLDFSGSRNNQYQKPQKNLFAPLYLPPKVVKHSPVPSSVKKVEKPIIKSKKVIQQQGSKPIQPLNVIGYLSKARDYTVFLSSKQGDIFLVKSGDIFANNLIVHSINSKEIVVGRQQTDQRVTLRLGEVKSQRLPDVGFMSGRPIFKIPIEHAKVKKTIMVENPKMDSNPFRDAIKKVKK